MDAGALVTPKLRRRLLCFVYEGVLLFGVVAVAGLLYGVLTEQRHALHGKLGLQVALFLVLGWYFTWFLSRSGQTLAMQTWHIRLVTNDGQPVTRWRALGRYLVSWLWFLPGLALVAATGIRGSGPVFGTLCAWILVYASLSRLHPTRQFVHDWLCGTRLVEAPPKPKLQTS